MQNSPCSINRSTRTRIVGVLLFGLFIWGWSQSPLDLHFSQLLSICTSIKNKLADRIVPRVSACILFFIQYFSTNYRFVIWQSLSFGESLSGFVCSSSSSDGSSCFPETLVQLDVDSYAMFCTCFPSFVFDKIKECIFRPHANEHIYTYIFMCKKYTCIYFHGHDVHEDTCGRACVSWSAEPQKSWVSWHRYCWVFLLDVPVPCNSEKKQEAFTRGSL